MDVSQIEDIGAKLGVAYAAIQGIAQGALALQRLGTKTPEKTLWFKFWKFLISGPARTPPVQ